MQMEATSRANTAEKKLKEAEEDLVHYKGQAQSLEVQLEMTKANDENEYNTLKSTLEKRIEEVREEEKRKKDEELGTAKRYTEEQR